MHNLVVSSLAVAYLAANTYAIVKGGVFRVSPFARAYPTLCHSLHILGLRHSDGM